MGAYESGFLVYARNGTGSSPGYSRLPVVGLELAAACASRYVFICFNQIMFFLTIITGPSLLRRLYESVAEARVHRAQHIEFSKTFSEENIAKWTEMVRVWNDSPKTSPNPYEEPVLGMSSIMFAMRLS